jgi:hypothetical protein
MGFSPCGTLLGIFAIHSGFFRNLFSRADKANKLSGTLVPEGCFVSNFTGILPFFRNL